MTRRLVVLCNALDDDIRIRRGITTDSPAASRKVFMMARAVRKATARVHVLSYARGRQDYSFRCYSGEASRSGGIGVFYLCFVKIPLISEIVSLLAPIAFLLRLRSRGGETTVIFYNRMAVHIPALLVAAVLGYRTVLDLEDGSVRVRQWSPRQMLGDFISDLFERVCNGGAIVACSALVAATKLRPTFCYYGTVEPVIQTPDWSAAKVLVLLGGTVSEDTGAKQLIDALRVLRDTSPSWCANVRIVVTGRGDCLDQFLKLESKTAVPEVEVLGRLTDDQYKSVASTVHVGLALKPSLGQLAQTTFPSKVIELANAGQVIVSTDISDVRLVFGTNALYILGGGAEELIVLIRWIVENRDLAAAMAGRAAAAVRDKCSQSTVGSQLLAFLFEGPA